MVTASEVEAALKERLEASNVVRSLASCFLPLTCQLLSHGHLFLCRWHTDSACQRCRASSTTLEGVDQHSLWL